MKRKLGYLLLFFLVPCMAEQQGESPVGSVLPAAEKLVYTVSYQGILTLGLPVDIAEARLQLHADNEVIGQRVHRRAQLSVTTEPFPRMEAFYPLRYDYQSWFDSEFKNVLLVSMRKETSKRKHDLVWFDHLRQKVRTYRAKRSAGGGQQPLLPAPVSRIVASASPATFGERRVVALSSEGVLDRMSMLYLLRGRQLEPGQRLEIPVSNGKDLRAYLIEAEARESVELAGEGVAAVRIRLQPQFDRGGSRGYQVRVWLSDDEDRLPLRFHSAKFGGAIELRLSARS